MRAYRLPIAHRAFAHRILTGAVAASLVLGGLLFGTAAPAQAQNTLTCIQGPVVQLRTPKAAEALATRRALNIVAIGSSSTRGVGASSDARTYPAILQAMLRERFPGTDIRVFNRGGNGEDVPENLARFDRDVRDLNPDLVLWQVGTNYVIRSPGMGNFSTLLRQGIGLIQSWGADAVIIDLQYSPWVNDNKNTPIMNAEIASVARSANASSYPRYALMKTWAEQQMVPMSQMLIIDRLHMTDWAYNCFTRSFAASLIPALGARSK